MASARDQKDDNPRLVALYLNHLKMRKEAPTLEYLCALQKQHIESVPHENIDGIFNLPTALEIPALLEKYINEKRGGLCFELNYSFAWLLFQLGFKVELILADVKAYNYTKEQNPVPTHPVIAVTIDAKLYLADVGWSDAYRAALSISEMQPYEDHSGRYRVQRRDKQFVMQKYLPEDANANAADAKQNFVWHDQFAFPEPTGPLKQFGMPNGYLDAHAYTHVGRYKGKDYTFTNLLHFTQPTRRGFYSLFGDKCFYKDDKERLVFSAEKQATLGLFEFFGVDPKVIKHCKKQSQLKRSRSESNLKSKAIALEEVAEPKTPKPGHIG